MKKGIFALSLLLLVPALAFAADVKSCQQLVAATVSGDDDASAARFFSNADSAFRDCQAAELPADLRARVFANYAFAQEVRGNTQTAVENYRAAIGVLDRARGDNSRLLMEVLDKAIYAESKAGLRSSALELANRSLTLRQRLFGPNSAEAITGTVALATVYITFEDFASAVPLLESAIRTAKKTCKGRCDSLAEAYAGMYALYSAQGNTAEAQRYDELVASAVPLRSHQKE